VLKYRFRITAIRAHEQGIWAVAVYWRKPSAN